MTKFVNPMKVITGPHTRWSYANVWEAKSIAGSTPKFSVSLIIPKDDVDTVNKIKAAIEAAYTEGAAKLGEAFGKRLQDKKITTVVFDRNGYLYHGVVKALADGTRKAGIIF